MTHAERFTEAYKAEGWNIQYGRILSPGKFEGQPIWLIEYWDLAMSGEGEVVDDEDGVLHTIFDINVTDVANWPDLAKFSKLDLWEDSQGFVRYVGVGH